MTRRDLMATLGALGLGTLVASACAAGPPEWAPLDPGAPEEGPFPDGVMAGDPRSDGSTIWTRVLPTAVDPGAAVPVMWSVATDPSFSNLVAGGVALATTETGHCLTVAVTGLPADRWFHFRFEALGQVSRSGRLRTAPGPGAPADRLRFAFASCQQLSSQFVAHRAIAAEPDLDFLLHLGDYVYVNDELTLDLEDYRDCYRRWRRQPHLRELHAALPTVAMWDDGEFYNGIDRSGPAERLEAAARAWFESFPVIDPGGRRAYRSLSWGDLVDMPVIDVRLFRDPASEETDYTREGVPHDPARTTLGTEQFAWLTALLSGSAAAWRVIGNPYNIAPWKLVNLEWLRPFRPGMPPEAGIYAPNEAWDDYLRERRDLLVHLADHGITDTVFASAHTHVFITSELRIDDRPGSGPVAVDFCTGSLTADPDPRIAYFPDLPLEVAEEVLEVAERWVIANNGPSMRHFNLVEQGYTVVEVTPEEMLVTHRVIDTHDPDATARDGARFRVRRGSARLERLACPSPVGVFA
jgi:alkaline phosphatase D